MPNDRQAVKRDSAGHTQKEGYLVVLSAPSGGGKTTIIKKLFQLQDPDFCYSISATTREPREGEQHGRDYYFISEQEFVEKIARDEFLEFARVHGNLYGTPKETIEHWIAQQKFVLMDVDVQGGLNIKKELGDRAILIFVQPPSLQSLQERLSARNTDSPAEINARLQVANRELEMAKHYDYIVVNHDISQTVKEILNIINSYRESTQPSPSAMATKKDK